MSSPSKNTHTLGLFCVILLLTVISILYQFIPYIPIGINYKKIPYIPIGINYKKIPKGNGKNFTDSSSASDTKKRVKDVLIFPALQNFSVKENIGPDFGKFPLKAEEVRLVHNFTDRLLFPYMPFMTQQEKLVSLFVFQQFINICFQNNINFFIQGGTLLGAFRHHGFVPWDDDIDVYINLKDKKKLYRSLKKAVPTFDVVQFPQFQWKFYYTNTPTLKESVFRWPYIDIFFYSVKGDDILDVTSARKYPVNKYHYVFPLGTALFEGAYLPAPCNPNGTITLAYKNGDICYTGGYIHKLEKRKNQTIVKTVPCKKLYGIYPFVYRTKSNISEDQFEEVLKVGSHILNTVIVKTGCSAKKAKP